MPRPQWISILRLTCPEMHRDGATEAETAALRGHAAYVSRLAEEGIIILVGRTQVDDEPMGIRIFYAEDEAAARASVAADPAVAGGVMRSEFFPYRVAWGNVEALREALEA